MKTFCKLSALLLLVLAVAVLPSVCDAGENDPGVMMRLTQYIIHQLFRASDKNIMTGESAGANIGGILTWDTGDTKKGEIPLAWGMQVVNVHNGLHGERGMIDFVYRKAREKKIDPAKIWSNLKLYTNLQPCWMCTLEIMARTNLKMVSYAMRDDSPNAKCCELYHRVDGKGDNCDEVFAGGEVNKKKWTEMMETYKKGKSYEFSVAIDNSDINGNLITKYMVQELHNSLRSADVANAMLEPQTMTTKMTFMKMSDVDSVNSLTEFPKGLESDEIKEEYKKGKDVVEKLLAETKSHISSYNMIKALKLKMSDAKDTEITKIIKNLGPKTLGTLDTSFQFGDQLDKFLDTLKKEHTDEKYKPPTVGSVIDKFWEKFKGLKNEKTEKLVKVYNFGDYDKVIKAVNDEKVKECSKKDDFECFYELMVKAYGKYYYASPKDDKLVNGLRKAFDAKSWKFRQAFPQRKKRVWGTSQKKKKKKNQHL